MTAPLRSVALANASPSPVMSRQTLPLGMAQLSPFGLSEDWVLKSCGDRHWSLIAQASGRDSLAFHDADGHPIYAAFCATSLRLTAPPSPILGQTLEVRSALFAVGTSRIGSRHILSVNGRDLAMLSMVSTFLRHDESGSNHRLLRGGLPGMCPLPAAIAPIQDLANRARATARRKDAFHPTQPPKLSITPNPALDFNAVGLLYFPTYSRISAMAMDHHPASFTRDVIYLGNLDMGEPIELFDTGPGQQTMVANGQPIAVIHCFT
ncbi:MAG: Pnap_2097 family protein [Pseudomonadota bacterium]